MVDLGFICRFDDIKCRECLFLLSFCFPIHGCRSIVIIIVSVAAMLRRSRMIALGFLWCSTLIDIDVIIGDILLGTGWSLLLVIFFFIGVTFLVLLPPCLPGERVYEIMRFIQLIIFII